VRVFADPRRERAAHRRVLHEFAVVPEASSLVEHDAAFTTPPRRRRPSKELRVIARLHTSSKRGAHPPRFAERRLATANPCSGRTVSNAYGNLIYSGDMPSPSAQDSKAYYDAFSKQYERIRGKNAPLG